LYFFIVIVKLDIEYVRIIRHVVAKNLGVASILGDIVVLSLAIFKLHWEIELGKVTSKIKLYQVIL
jgi:hypothetical protein